jgi:hypothetical protein
VKGRKFSVRNKQSKLGSLLYEHRTVAVVGTDGKKVPVASARRGLDKSIPNSVSKAEGVENVLPVRPPEDKGLPCFICQSSSLRFELHHGLECTFSIRPMS